MSTDESSAIAADAQFPVDGLVFEGPCSEVVLNPGRHIFRPRLPMTNWRLPDAAGRSARALRTATGCWWQLIRIVLRRGSAPQQGYCDKGITHCNCAHRHVLRWLLDQPSLGARQEIADRRGDLVAVRLERKVAGVEEAHVCVRDVAFERLRTGRQEERIVLAPHC